MLIKIFLFTSSMAALCSSEAPFNGYAPAGYRPDTPFDLPGEFYPQYDFDSSQQLPNQGISFEITKQRVDFAGQEVQSVAISEPQNQYLPPQQIIFIGNTVGNNKTRNEFNHGHRRDHGRRHGNRHGGRNDGRPENRPPQIPTFGFPQRPDFRPPQRPDFRPPSDQPQTTPASVEPSLPPANIPLPIPNPTTDERFESQQRPALQYGAPIYNLDPRYAGQQQQQQPQPAQQYGAPLNNEEEQEKQYALDVLNAAVQNYNRLQEDKNEEIAQGQYFVVNPDHSIQKVKFTTQKTGDEKRQNDFTATLQYTKVGEINDPLYKYTSEGQLVRIVK